MQSLTLMDAVERRLIARRSLYLAALLYREGLAVHFSLKTWTAPVNFSSNWANGSPATRSQLLYGRELQNIDIAMQVISAVGAILNGNEELHLSHGQFLSLRRGTDQALGRITV